MLVGHTKPEWLAALQAELDKVPEDAESIVIGRAPTLQRAGDASLALPFDRSVSRLHARIWRDAEKWRIEDLGSTNGTFVDGVNIAELQPVELEPGIAVQIGETLLSVAPPNWLRLEDSRVAVELQPANAVSYALAHAGKPIASHVTVRSLAPDGADAAMLEVAIPEAASTGAMPVPVLGPGDSHTIRKASYRLCGGVLETLAEPRRGLIHVTLNGRTLDSAGIDCWLHAHNEWSLLPEHWDSLACFVLPNHPLVTQLSFDACSDVGPEMDPERTITAIYRHLHCRWRMAYRYEPPHWASDSQKLRLPHQMLLDFDARRGEGTCIDIALLIAACLERLHLHPLIAVLDLGQCWHALVGCWRTTQPRMEHLVRNAEVAMRGAVWLEPTGCTRDEYHRREADAARQEAAARLEQDRLLFVLDVAAARYKGLQPLPFSGEPQWSEPARRALRAAEQLAAACSTQLATVPLLVGLLTNENGLARRTVGRHVRDIDSQLGRLCAALPRSAKSDSSPSTHYREVLTKARSWAKEQGSPVVLETHLLSALLKVESTSLDNALKGLGTDRTELRESLSRLYDIKSLDPMPHTVYSEFPTTF